MRKRLLFMPVIAFVALLTFQPLTAQSSTLKIAWTQISHEPATGASISPDGKQVVFGNWKTNQLTLMDWRTKKVIWQASQYFNMVGNLYWSPDGKYIAAISGGSIHLYEAANGDHVSKSEIYLDAYENLLGVMSGTEEMGVVYSDLKWGTNSREFAVMVHGYVLVYDLTFNKIMTVVDVTAVPPPNDVHSYLYWFDWSPDGSKFAAYHFKLDDNGVPVLPVTISMGFWDKNGRWLPQYEQSNTLEEACVPDGEDIFAGFAYPPGNDIAWGPDNKTLAVGTAQLTLCTLEDDGTLTVRKISDTGASAFHWTANQKWLIGYIGECSFLISDVANNYETHSESFGEPSGEHCMGGSISWSQDDHYIALGGDDGLWVGTVEFP
ncbi:MAG: hypothetical protein H0X30_34430 [Anaerolineae bacterium]|nr:hypothetical protein [Anaerolineae bacterium]